ncbi:hypothetical protein L1987_78519 [Smallanthus sonchifolius]|uniref:Uncharacterized protein n=1 Tax=Smallanthus sonchifolius TaxID=185202 RepID=A0ACB8ZCL5_9ASTR|nr:hypothetical protein L1987_78519 [Smallanthus sonchifolius]
MEEENNSKIELSSSGCPIHTAVRHLTWACGIRFLGDGFWSGPHTAMYLTRMAVRNLTSRDRQEDVGSGWGMEGAGRGVRVHGAGRGGRVDMAGSGMDRAGRTGSRSRVDREGRGRWVDMAGRSTWVEEEEEEGDGEWEWEWEWEEGEGEGEEDGAVRGVGVEAWRGQ